MTRKRTTNQSKLADIEALLRKLEEKTAREVKDRLGGHWRDNLFEILMTRLEIAKQHKKTFAAIPAVLGQTPQAVPKFTKLFLKTMHNILVLAEAPAAPPQVAAFSILYVSIIDVFLKDDSKDLAKTMAALDKRLGLFEQFADFTACNKTS